MRENSSPTEEEEEKTEALLKLFYPPLPPIIKEDPERTHPPLIKEPEISIEEIRNKIFMAKQ